MRYAIIVLALLLAGCPAGQAPSHSLSAGGSGVVPALSVSLLRTDLGLADGGLVREADSALSELSRQGQISYIGVGELPPELITEGGTGDVGLPGAPVPQGTKPTGIMDSAGAQKLAAGLHDCDVVVVSSSIAARPVLARIKAGTLKAGLLVVLDDDGPALDSGTTPVVQLHYDIRAAAFLVGVAAGTSSRSQAFVAFTSTQDPHSADFLQCLRAGLRFRMAGANLLSASLTPDADNVVAPDEFKTKRDRIFATPGLKTDHFIVDAGRATASIMFALSTKPTNGYLLGGYGDFRQVRPARVVCCIVKHPGSSLRKLLTGAKSVKDVQAAGMSLPKLDLANGGVDVTDFSAYAHYNPDSDDIADAVKDARGQILDGELDVTK